MKKWLLNSLNLHYAALYKKMMQQLSLIAFLISVTLGFTQNPDSAKKYIQTLAGQSFYGRGYVNQGDKLAADYIAAHYRKCGLVPINGFMDYFQKFKLDVNVFRENPTVKIHQLLQPGKDYIINPDSKPTKGKYNVKIIDASNYLKAKETIDFEKHAILFDPKKIKEPAKNAEWNALVKQAKEKSPFTLLINYKKLTWSVGRTANENPYVEVLKDSSFDASKIKKVRFDIQPEFIKNYESQNVVGMVKGEIVDTFLIVCAHYDHLGMMGNAVFAGANDNASGTALMMDLAAEYSKGPKPKYNIIFIAFGSEEAGLVGSKFFVENSPIPLKSVRFVFNIDLMGGGNNGATIVNATLHEKEFERLEKTNTELNLLKQVKKRGKAANSDHYYFSEAGVPAFFMYAEGGVTAYHDVEDIPEKLPMENYSKLYTLIKRFLDGF
jgi:hypothetical protein